MFCVCFLSSSCVFSCIVLFVSISQVIGCEDHLQNHLHCVMRDVELQWHNEQLLCMASGQLSHCVIITIVYLFSLQKFIREGCLQKLSHKGFQQRMFFLVRTFLFTRTNINVNYVNLRVCCDVDFHCLWLSSFSADATVCCEA